MEINSARANTSSGYVIEKSKTDLNLPNRLDDKDVNRSQENLLLRRSGNSIPNWQINHIFKSFNIL